MPRIEWTPTSRGDLADILVYLRVRSPQSARRVHRAILKTIDFLAANPNAGPRREEFSPGIRSFPVDGYRAYLVFYKPLKDGIVVARLVHGSRDVGSLFGRS